MTVYGWPKVKLFYYIIIKSAFHCFLQLGDIYFSSWDIIFFVTSGFRESKALSVGHISKRFELKNLCCIEAVFKFSRGGGGIFAVFPVQQNPGAYIYPYVISRVIWILFSTNRMFRLLENHFVLFLMRPIVYLYCFLQQ